MPTPMMQQYFEQKEQYKDTLLFFRMGDFFELFFDDAITASKVLDIALTKRGKNEGEEIPMCGVPAHAYESYLQKLIRSGFKVAICDQLESPVDAKKRGYKEIVRREVIRVITAGTITEETLLESAKPNYLLALSLQDKEFALSWVDISTGSFNCCKITEAQLWAELARINPSEILLPENLIYQQNLFETYAEYRQKLTPQPNNIFEFKRAENKLKTFYKVIALESFGNLSRAEISACGALLEYLDITQKSALPNLEFPKNYKHENFMQIDAATRSNLELTTSQHPESPTVFSVINRTQTSGGARLLYQLLASPLAYESAINRRLDAVEFFTKQPALCANLHNQLKQMPDMERALSRICLGRASARDMLALKQALITAYEIKQQLNINLPPLLADICADINPQNAILAELIDAFKDEAPAQLKDGNFIREGYNQKLDELINIRDYSRQLINSLKEKYAAESGISNLKITYNNILGYFVEVTALNAKKLGEQFIHRQTMANAMRFTTAELAELEQKIISARDEAFKIEIELFEEISAKIRNCAEILLQTARSVSFIDVLASFAELAIQNNYCRPVVDDSQTFTITKGRHVVIEKQTAFTANNCNLNYTQNTWLLTGPNMAGKSTYLRQNALIAILAQIGCFVPAEAAHIGCVDRVFSRVGASDNLSKGQSTFMVEMLETAAILNQATNKSLVILDEIGRGTATYDGLSIAWAVLEYIHNKIRCRTIFATHYHELTSIKLERLQLYSVKVKEWKDEIVFLHEVEQGAADKSYGIHVAKLAGFPRVVTARAENILKSLESGGSSGNALPLFEVSSQPQQLQKSKVNELLENIDPNNLTPKEALDWLFKLKENLPN